MLARQGEQRPAAPDLDVVGVAADREHAPQRRPAAGEREREHQAGLGSCSSWRPTLAPGRAARLVQPLEPLPVLDRVHRPEEALVREGDDLAAGDQPRERLLDELVSRLDPVEQLAAAHEEAAVDPHVGVAHVLDRRDDSLLVRDHAVRVELGPHGEELDQPAGAPERVDHLVERRVREAVAVGREELVVVVQVRARRPSAARRSSPACPCRRR